MRTASALAAYAIGLPAFVLVKALTPGFFAREDTRTPLYVGVASIAFNAALNTAFLFYTSLDQVGIALATTLSAWLNTLWLAVILRRRDQWIPDGRLTSRFVRMLLASAGMAAALWFGLMPLRSALSHADLAGVAALAAICALGGLAYGLLALALRIVNLTDLRFLRRHANAHVGPTTPIDPNEPP